MTTLVHSAFPVGSFTGHALLGRGALGMHFVYWLLMRSHSSRSPRGWSLCRAGGSEVTVVPFDKCAAPSYQQQKVYEGVWGVVFFLTHSEQTPGQHGKLPPLSTSIPHPCVFPLPPLSTPRPQTEAAGAPHYAVTRKPLLHLLLLL